MADAVRHVCGNCGHAIEAWSDGNPYYIDKTGAKQYAYHPDHKRLNRCIGNDCPHLCLTCGYEFTVDSRSQNTVCPRCKALEIAETYKLGGQQCPYCKDGKFPTDPEIYAIS